MKSFPTTNMAITAASFLALVSAPAIAQQIETPQREGEVQTERTEKRSPRFLKQSDVTGAEVTNGQKGDSRVVLGSIGDLVIDGRTGEVRHLILESGGTLGIGEKQTAIAWDYIGCDRENGFTLAMTAEEIEAKPKFDPTKLSALSGDATATNARSEGAEVGTDEAALAASSSLILASQIGDCPVHASKDNLGKGMTLFIEPSHGQVAFAQVSVGGIAGIGDSNYVLPWQAVSVVEPVGEEGERTVRIAKSKAALEVAPKLEDEGADMDDPKFRSKIYEFYGVERPAFEPARAASDSSVGTQSSNS